MKKQKLPEGYTEEQIRAIAEYYENQGDEEAEAEWEGALSDPRFSWVQVPVEMVEEVQRLIARTERRARQSSKPASTKVAEAKRKYGADK